MIKNFLFSFLVVFSVALVSCSKDDEVTKENVFTYESGGKSFNYSANVSGFKNLLDSYTIMAKLNDTTYITVVIPSLKTGTYTNAANSENASISLNDGNLYSSHYGTDASFTIEIKSVTSTYVEGTFSAKLGNVGTALGFESTYLEIKNGQFGFKL